MKEKGTDGAMKNVFLAGSVPTRKAVMNMNQNNQGLEFLDVLTIVSFVMQFANYRELKSQASTDDIFSELQRQDNEYLIRILENQEKVLEKLNTL